jgi:hypothetical protein
MTPHVKKNNNWKFPRMKKGIRYISNYFNGTNIATFAGALFVFNALLFNFCYNGQEWLKDLWYVSFYLVVCLLFFYLKDLNEITKAAFWVAVVRTIYNLGIFIKLIEYNTSKKNDGLICLIVLILIYCDSKIIRRWVKLRLHSVFCGLKTLSFSLRSYFKFAIRWIQKVL